MCFFVETCQLAKKFNAYLKAIDQSVQVKEKQLLIELKRINDFLDNRGTTYLSGNEMTLIDCDLMPKWANLFFKY